MKLYTTNRWYISYVAASSVIQALIISSQDVCEDGVMGDWVDEGCFTVVSDAEESSIGDWGSG